MQIVTQAELSNKMPSYQGKVRDLYDLGDQLLIISLWDSHGLFA